MINRIKKSTEETIGLTDSFTRHPRTASYIQGEDEWVDENPELPNSEDLESEPSEVEETDMEYSEEEPEQNLTEEPVDLGEYSEDQDLEEAPYESSSVYAKRRAVVDRLRKVLSIYRQRSKS